mgnify:CR=1 FL=1
MVPGGFLEGGTNHRNGCGSGIGRWSIPACACCPAGQGGRGVGPICDGCSGLPVRETCRNHKGMSCWAAIFDWDGVIVDSSRAHERAWERLAAEVGRPLFPGFFLRSFGMKNERVIRELLGWTADPAELARLGLRKEELFREEIRENPLQPLPGVRPFLERLQTAGVSCAVGSSTPRANIECVIDGLGLRPMFRAIVTGEDVQKGKPDPEVFLRAAERLGVPPERCVVFEDAPVGIEAARRAGMRVVGVAGTHPAEKLVGCDRVVHRLDELTVEELSSWFGSVAPGAGVGMAGGPACAPGRLGPV